ncbi:MAG: hypothetical protein J0I77_02735 [Rudaea sp.]|uniref:hypothetical protein n=1 Tax=unclassified Rudaea TaxID=2627037 RepID=UPI0010F5719F|nr:MULTISPECIES: hypothetical protein [unclassified Rudaea]MBN8884615.1 hypothetical protein [Rudaea sp.]
MNPAILWALLTCLLILEIVAIHFVGTKLAVQYGGDVRTIWYLFWLAVVCTSILALGAKFYGSIDAAGNFQGQSGSWLKWALNFTLDLPGDAEFFVGLFVVVVVPQWLSWLFSGLWFGCAEDSVFVGTAWTVMIWGLVKSWLVAAGVFFPAHVWGCILGWPDFSMSSVVGSIFLSTSLLCVAFVYLSFYRNLWWQTEENNTKIMRFRAFMKRRSTAADPQRRTLDASTRSRRPEGLI